jgi:hypothetical protein
VIRIVVMFQLRDARHTNETLVVACVVLVGICLYV